MIFTLHAEIFVPRVLSFALDQTRENEKNDR